MYIQYINVGLLCTTKLNSDEFVMTGINNKIFSSISDYICAFCIPSSVNQLKIKGKKETLKTNEVLKRHRHERKEQENNAVERNLNSSAVSSMAFDFIAEIKPFKMLNIHFVSYFRKKKVFMFIRNVRYLLRLLFQKY